MKLKKKCKSIGTSKPKSSVIGDDANKPIKREKSTVNTGCFLRLQSTW